jgi:hypothetical protein
MYQYSSYNGWIKHSPSKFQQQHHQTQSHVSTTTVALSGGPAALTYTLGLEQALVEEQIHKTQ